MSSTKELIPIAARTGAITFSATPFLLYFGNSSNDFFPGDGDWDSYLDGDLYMECLDRDIIFGDDPSAVLGLDLGDFGFYSSSSRAMNAFLLGSGYYYSFISLKTWSSSASLKA